MNRSEAYKYLTDRMNAACVSGDEYLRDNVDRMLEYDCRGDSGKLYTIQLRIVSEPDGYRVSGKVHDNSTLTFSVLEEGMFVR